MVSIIIWDSKWGGDARKGECCSFIRGYVRKKCYQECQIEKWSMLMKFCLVRSRVKRIICLAYGCCKGSSVFRMFLKEFRESEWIICGCFYKLRKKEKKESYRFYFYIIRKNINCLFFFNNLSNNYLI